jgi:predicted acyltransferase
MCWIVGLDAVVSGLCRLSGETPLTTVVVQQLEHVAWEGCRFYDLIFPLFVFLSGVSLAVAIPRRVARSGERSTALHLVWRGALLFGLGVIYSGGFSDGLENVRWMGVLQRIGLASAIAGLLCIWLRPRGLVLACAALLAGYWALLTFVPLGEFGAGDFSEGRNLADALDARFLPGRKYPTGADHDPEGLLSTLPAIGTALLGVLTGCWLFSAQPGGRKVLGLLVAGGVLLGAGMAWDASFPIIKKIWTSSFVLYAGGWSLLLLGAFYLVIDVFGWQAWARPFQWVGANPIALYLASGLGFFSNVAERLVGRPPAPWSWAPDLAAFALVLWTARWLYRRGIMLRV